MRDCDLIPEDRYKVRNLFWLGGDVGGQCARSFSWERVSALNEKNPEKVSRIQKSERKKKAIYELLDWFEKEQAQHIRRFWTCILQETLLEQCPTLRRLHKSLMDGSYQFDSELPESTQRAQPPGSEVTPVREKGKVKPLESKACEEPSEAPSPAKRSSAKLLCSEDQVQQQLAGKPPEEAGQLGALDARPGKRVQDAPADDTCETSDPVCFNQQPVSPASSPAKRRSCPSPSVLDTLQLETSPGVEGRLEPVPTGRAGHAQDQAVLGVFDFTRQRRPLVSSGNETPGKKKAKTKHLTAVDKEEESLTEKSKCREDERDIWTWPIYKSQLPVTCGHLQGKLHRKRLTKGLPCIFSHHRWYTPTEFEEAGGKKSCKNWKTSIRCESVMLDLLIKSGHLQCGSFRRWHQKRDVTLHSRAVFEVTCGTACGKLHKQRFASGSCGLSVRTEERWMTPEEFMTAAPHVANPAWSRDILWEGRPLSLLVEVRRGLPSLSSQAICHDDNKPDKTRMQPMVVVFTRLSMDCALFQREVLRVHPSECFCVLCKPSAEDLESQRNDDGCCVCQCETEEQLVVCDQCPRAFHQWCHLPQVDDATLRDNNKWLCTFCIFKNSQDWCYSNESGRDKAELLGSAVSSYMMQCQYLLLYLYTSDETHLLPGHKMQLSRRLQSHQIQTIGEFESEVKSLFTRGRSTHQRVSGLQDDGKKQEALYNLLDRFAETKPQDIKLFWKCVLQETLLEQCPTLKRLHSKLMSESHRLAPPSTPAKKKEKTKHVASVADDEQPSLSSPPAQGGNSEASRFQPVKKSDSQTPANLTYPLPVTCGTLKGKLYKKKFVKGEASIFSNLHWYTPTQFVVAAGKSSKHWKSSIRYHSVTMDALIKDGHLQSGSSRSAQKKLGTKDASGEKPKGQLDSRAVFEVTCGAASGKLHKQRFASGSCGMSVRTETRWVTPEEFVKAAPHVANPAWSRDILWEGRPLSLLVEVRRGLPSLSSQAICHDDNKPDKTRMQPMVVVFTRLSMDCALFQREVLRVHPSECFCVLCKPSAEDLESQRNDDGCCVCQCETEEQLVVCDQCPRAFHQWCHLPQVDDATLRDNNKWLCTFCIFKNSQDWCYSNESGLDKAELLGSAVSSYMMQCQYLLLYLYTSDETHLLPGHKMQLSRRLQSHQIQTIGEFESEVKSLFTRGRSTHQRVSGLQDDGKKQEALYNLLDRFAETKPQDIKLFWKCVLQETLLEQCPTLKRLHSKLMSESHRLAPPSTPAKKKEKTKHVASVADDEQPSLSSPPAQGGNSEASRFQPVKKSDSQTPANLTYPLPVTCGTLKGKLYKKKFEKGEASIFSNLHWYTPTQFVVAAGKSSKHWKSSIRYHSVTMDALIKDGHLQSGSSRSAQKKLGTKDASGEKPKGQLDSRAVFEVTCGAASGKLHKQRFASGSCGMSVRTKTRWMTPEEFVKAAPHVANPAWSRDIQCEGRPLSLLVKSGILHVHPTGCCCGICKPSAEDLRRKRNDDKCCLCKADIGEQLVLCTQCPRAFHRMCHLPQVDNSMLRDHVDWLCTFCTFKRIQELHHRYESKKDKTQLLKSKISDYKMQCQYLLLYLYSSDETQVLPEYKTLLGRRLQNNQIQTIGEFDSEIRVLFIVSNSHYQGQTETLDTCQRLQQRFNRKFDEVFNVH
ncbi:uncharacterized protein ACB058_020715 [Synchiropus picturatus]